MAARGLTAARAHLDAIAPAFRARLRELVDINSFTHNPPGVARVADVTAEMMAPLGFADYRLDTGEGDGRAYGQHQLLHAPAARRGSGPAPSVLLVSHHDTVYPPEVDFAWHEVGGPLDSIRGPGVMDIKGGTVAIALTLEALRAMDEDAYAGVDWLILNNAAEEVMAFDTAPVVREAATSCGAAWPPLAAVVFEAGAPSRAEGAVDESFAYVTGRKGMRIWRVEATGSEAHAGNAHADGVSAVDTIVRVCAALGDVTDYDRGITVNVGTVSGGTATNTVPAHAEARVEMRAVGTAAFEHGVARVEAILGGDGVVPGPPGKLAELRWQYVGGCEPWEENEETEWLFEQFKAGCEEAGYTARPQFRGGLSDANFLWRECPTIDGAGPLGAHAHCSVEEAAAGKHAEVVEWASAVPKALANAASLRRIIHAKTAERASGD